MRGDKKNSCSHIFILKAKFKNKVTYIQRICLAADAADAAGVNSDTANVVVIPIYLSTMLSFETDDTKIKLIKKNTVEQQRDSISLDGIICFLSFSFLLIFLIFRCTVLTCV